MGFHRFQAIAIANIKSRQSGLEPEIFVFVFTIEIFSNIQIVTLRGVVIDLWDLRDKGPGFKTGSRLLTFPTRCEVLIVLTNTFESRHAKDVKTI